jgi:glutamyl-tRNA synthetase
METLRQAMDWLGLAADEDPVYQSSRTDAHLAAAEDLLSRGLAYKADKGETGQGEAVIFKMPQRDMAFTDLIKGDLRKKAENMQDLVIVRSNGTPVFHLANVLDDLHMGITHVIRGDDHVENTFRHIALFEALGAEAPQFAHLPMIVNAQGKPYSKRDGDAYVGDFRSQGYLPDALFNYLALLGWSPGDDREVMTRDEMVNAFDLNNVQSSAAQMDLKKLQWMNGAYIQGMDAAEFNVLAIQALDASGIQRPDDGSYTEKVLALLQPRIKLLPEVEAQGRYFFEDAFPFDEKAVRKRLAKDVPLEQLAAVRDRFSALEEFTSENLDAVLNELAAERDCEAFAFFPALRISVSGLAGGPDLLPLLALLGKKKVLSRINQALETHGNT